MQPPKPDTAHKFVTVTIENLGERAMCARCRLIVPQLGAVFLGPCEPKAATARPKLEVVPNIGQKIGQVAA